MGIYQFNIIIDSCYVHRVDTNSEIEFMQLNQKLSANKYHVYRTVAQEQAL